MFTTLPHHHHFGHILPATASPTFEMFWEYCFMAIFSTVLSNPKKDLMSRVAVCSKHVQSLFSGWTWWVKGKKDVVANGG